MQGPYRYLRHAARPTEKRHSANKKIASCYRISGKARVVAVLSIPSFTSARGPWRAKVGTSTFKTRVERTKGHAPQLQGYEKGRKF